MRPRESRSQWIALESQSHTQGAQDQIRRAIRRGLIRVVPAGPDQIRIIPCHEDGDLVAPPERLRQLESSL